MTDEVRDHTLKAYFHYCKEKAAKLFLEWRILESKIVKDSSKKKALRLARITNFKKYDKEEEIF